MAPDDVLGDPGTPVVLGTENNQVGAQFVRSLEDDVRDVVFGGVDEFTVDGDSRCGEVVDRVLHDFSFTGGDVVFTVEDAEPGPGVDVGGDDVAACDVQQVDCPSGHLRELDGSVQRIVGCVRRYVYGDEYPVVHSHSTPFKGLVVST